VVIAALKWDEPLATLAERLDVHSNPITPWKTPLWENASGVFTTAAEKPAATLNLKEQHVKIDPPVLGAGD
jgi:transposase